jgi:hypothetical protein
MSDRKSSNLPVSFCHFLDFLCCLSLVGACVGKELTSCGVELLSEWPPSFPPTPDHVVLLCIMNSSIALTLLVPAAASPLFLCVRISLFLRLYAGGLHSVPFGRILVRFMNMAVVWHLVGCIPIVATVSTLSVLHVVRNFSVLRNGMRCEGVDGTSPRQL